ncbi:hypothetical protein [Planctomyces sp. SH-PL14]|uniref:hypothetical protein n=1 Tax=Planctomyces sp. SH-PL14 TaxID=1632864 RepID=UPI00094621F5|nr:hypothetical protein [Planctomyces sp. SH-PL14]
MIFSFVVAKLSAKIDASSDSHQVRLFKGTLVVRRGQLAGGLIAEEFFRGQTHFLGGVRGQVAAASGNGLFEEFRVDIICPVSSRWTKHACPPLL